MYWFSVGSFRLSFDSAVRTGRASIELARAVSINFIVFGGVAINVSFRI
jgi:hypothetical protein